MTTWILLAGGQGINQIINIQLQVRDQAKYQEQARLEAIQGCKIKKLKSLAKSGFERRARWCLACWLQRTIFSACANAFDGDGCENRVELLAGLNDHHSRSC